MSEYPKVVPVRDGYEVKVARKVKLPGIYLNERVAEQAGRFYLGQKDAAAKKRKS